MADLSVVGLGKLGAPLALVLASGYSVIGVDKNQEVLEAVRDGCSHIYEPKAREFYEKNKGNLSLTDNIEWAVQNSFVTFVIVPTPSDETHRFTNRYLMAALEEVARAITTYHVVVVVSTVMPETMGKEAWSLIEEHAEGEFGLVYNPEFVALGSVIEDFLNPDLLLIGESDERAGSIVEGIYLKILDNPKVFRTSLVNAELAKLAINSYLVAKISFANTLALLCEKVGANIDELSDILGADTRIGRKFLTGGAPAGGTCLPRDARALCTLCGENSLDAILPKAIRDFNDNAHYPWVRKIREAGNSVTILGLSYKCGTNIAEESLGVLLANELAEQMSVTVYDPVAVHDAHKRLVGSVKYCGDLEEAVMASEVIVIATPWESFRKAERYFGNKVVIDVWGLFEGKIGIGR